MNHPDRPLAPALTFALAFLALGCGGSEAAGPLEHRSAPVTEAAATPSSKSGAEETLAAEATAGDALAAAPDLAPGAAGTPLAEASAEDALTGQTPTPDSLPQTFEHDGMHLARILLTREVVEREPVEPADTFRATGDKLFVFLEVRNESDLDRLLRVTFEGPNQRSTGHVDVLVPAHAPRWRTWAYTRHAVTGGDWVAEVRAEDGTLLGRHPFRVE